MNFKNRGIFYNFVYLNLIILTNAEITSRIINGLNSLSKDDRISRRYVLHVARQKSTFFIATKLADRSLHREDNLYSILDCFEMEQIETTKCDIIEFRNCRIIMKSKKRLPKLIYSKDGNSLKEVTSIDDFIELKPTTPSQFRRDSRRAGTDDFVRYYVKDGYLYILDREILRVNLYFITMETEKLEELSECSKPSCKSMWEYDFIVPDKMEEVVVSEAIKEISMRKQIPGDTNPNLDNNLKGKTNA